MISHLLRDGDTSQDLGGNSFDERDRQVVQKQLVRRLERMGDEDRTSASGVGGLTLLVSRSFLSPADRVQLVGSFLVPFSLPLRAFPCFLGVRSALPPSDMSLARFHLALFPSVTTAHCSNWAVSSQLKRFGEDFFRRDGKRLEDQTVALGGWKLMRSRRAEMSSDLAHTEKQVMHVLRPRLVVAFGDEQTIAEEMGSTDAMYTAIAIVAAPAIMDRSSSILGQNSNRIHGLLPPLTMPMIEGQPSRGIDVKPMQQPFDSCSRFVHMIQLLCQQQLLENLHRRL